MSAARARPLPRSRSADWLGLSDASDVLGVSPGTLRRWADAGQVRSFTTPGGHRRFSRHTLQRLLPADREHRPTVAVMGVTTQRLVRAYRLAGRRDTPAAWVLALTRVDREAFRALGRTVVTHLLGHLDAETAESRQHHLREAKTHAADYGRRTSLLGLSLSQGVESFLRFRAPFIAELAAVAPRRGLHAAEATELLQTAEAAMDVLLIAMMTGHSVAGVSRLGGAAADVTPEASRGRAAR